MRTLFVSDLDGTLMGPDSRVSERSVQLLNEAIERGALFTAATARTPATVQPLMEGIAPVAGVPAIVMTGAGLWDRGSCSFVSSRLMGREDAEDVSEVFGRQGLRPFVYCLSERGFINVYHSAELTRREEAFYRERRRLPLKRFHLGQEPRTKERVALMFATGPVGQVQRACEALREATECAASWYMDIYDPSSGLIDIYAPGVSKASALEALRQSVGAERTVVYGDNLNDIPMMRCADVAVAVENALGPVKEVADVVIGPNSTDAVARHILELSGD